MVGLVTAKGLALAVGQAADRGQPSRRPCAVADARAIPISLFPICCCSSRAAIASCCWSRASAATAGSPPRSTTPPARRSTRPRSCSASAFPAVRRSSARPRAGDPRAVPLPRPLLGSAEPHFSFAGLKSAVLRARDSGLLQRRGHRRLVPAGGGRLPGRPHPPRARCRAAARPLWSSPAASPPTPSVRGALTALADDTWPALRRAAAVAVHRQCRDDRLGGRAALRARA